VYSFGVKMVKKLESGCVWVGQAHVHKFIQGVKVSRHSDVEDLACILWTQWHNEQVDDGYT